MQTIVPPGFPNPETVAMSQAAIDAQRFIKEFGIGLKNLRLLAELTQAQAARKVGVRQASWSRWERGERCPDPLTSLWVLECLKSLAGRDDVKPAA